MLYKDNISWNTMNMDEKNMDEKNMDGKPNYYAQYLLFLC